jgi:hypothetical protein
MMTEGDKRWISNWSKLKKSSMKPPKKKPAKYGPSFAERNPLLSKLLDLKYRISQEPEWYDQRDSYTKADKKWVESLINDVRHNSITKLCREDMQACNRLWRDYERK